MPGDRTGLPLCGFGLPAWKAAPTRRSPCLSVFGRSTAIFPAAAWLGVLCMSWSRLAWLPSLPAAPPFSRPASPPASRDLPVRGRDLFAPGLSRAGLDPDRVIYAEAARERDILPLVEEGLHERGLAAVVGEVTRLGLTASRRLQLAAEESGVTALVIRRWWTIAEKDLMLLPTAAKTRWRVAPAPSEQMPAPGLGRDRWQVELLRCRGAEPRSWIVEACDAKGRLALPADLADRPDQAAVRRAAAP